MTAAIKHKNPGFTLIELSVVLVVIGLVVAGVLMGRDLIEDAQTKKTIKSLESFRTAYYTFRGKYNGIPGDIRTPNVFWPEIGSIEGDGNGYIDGDIANEPSYAWMQLALAGLVIIDMPTPSTYVYGIAPTATSATFWYYRDYTGALASRQGNSIHISGIPTVTDAAAGITALQGQQIDRKLDNGMPESGKIWGLAPVVAGLSIDSCADITGYAVLGDNELDCRMMYIIE